MTAGIGEGMRALRHACKQWVTGALLIATMGSASAYTLTVNPSTQTVGIGSQIGISVTASDLLPGALGGYSFDLSFQEGVLGFSRVVDGFGMGSNSFGLSYALAGNVLSLTDTSFDDEATLLSLQSPSFTLFTVYFDAIGAGTSLLSISNATLADAYGGSAFVESFDGSVTVTAVTTPVPEPGTLSLLAMGGLALAWARGRNRQAQRQA